MHQEKYSLTWHTYSEHLKNMMKELMMNEDFSDITLITEDKKQIKANINILSACSPFFKDILKKEKYSSTIMYLKGVQYSEMESIIQFIYLGEATFNVERMDKFLTAAKSLEIKELCNAKMETSDEPEDQPPTTDQGALYENMKEQTSVSDHFTEKPPQKRRDINGQFECEPCQKMFTSKTGLNYHTESVHQGVKYACDQCNYKASTQSNLSRHIQSKHEGVKYACDQCDYQASRKDILTKHIQAMHG